MSSEKDITNQKNLLDTHRRTLARYLNQRTGFGVGLDQPNVARRINEARNAIRRIKGILRDWGVVVEDQPDDENPNDKVYPAHPILPTSPPKEPSQIRHQSEKQADHRYPIVLSPYARRLEALGFQHDPFDLTLTEKMQLEMLEETLVDHPGINDYVMNLSRSTVLLASQGDQMVNRRRLELYLNKRRENTLRGQSPVDGYPYVPLVIVYDKFNQFFNHSSINNVQNHVKPLLSAIARSFCIFIEDNPKKFIYQSRILKNWWWTFLETYFPGISIENRLRESRHLIEDFAKSERTVLFQPGSNLEDILISIQSFCADLEIDSLFILVDGFNIHLQNQATIHLNNCLEERYKQQLNTVTLRKIIIKHFNNSDLQDLCFELRIDYDDLDGQRKGDKARELILYTERHGNINELMRKLRDIRPNIDWSNAEQTISSERLQNQYSPQMETLIVTLLNSLPFLSPSHVFWKIFLPDVLKEIVCNLDCCRNQEVIPVLIQWNETRLKEFLHQRLVWASGGKVRDIAQLCTQHLVNSVDVESQLISMALRYDHFGPSAALCKLGNQLLQNMQMECLSPDEWYKFVDQVEPGLKTARHQ